MTFGNIILDRLSGTNEASKVDLLEETSDILRFSIYVRQAITNLRLIQAYTPIPMSDKPFLNFWAPILSFKMAKIPKPATLNSLLGRIAASARGDQ